MGLILPSLDDCTVAVIGLGYVGLPLAVEFAKPQCCVRTGKSLRRRVIGFDINQKRLEELCNGHDSTKETTSDQLQAASLLDFTSNVADLAAADVFVITVPTPIDSAKRPNLKPLEKASITVGQALKARVDYQSSNQKTTSVPLVIYESTVYPGATEEVCVPILEKTSGLVSNVGFASGYSPERINPGDNKHRLTTILKITSGSTPEVAAWIDGLYGSIISAGTHKAASIRVAEAAKVIENTQRDVNIALVNELNIIFRQLNIDTLSVLEAAATKWNFLPFKPGLVGGHCIGVDPYYLTHKAEEVGYHPQIVLAGRRINDGMGRWIAEQIVLELAKRGEHIVGANILVMGLTFKENCPDLRNTKVIDLIEGLKLYGINIDVFDPWANKEDAKEQYSLSIYDCIHTLKSKQAKYSVISVVVAHDDFKSLKATEFSNLLENKGFIVDLKGCLPPAINAIRI